MGRIALGWKTHSGWAALVALAARKDAAEVVQRLRVDLVLREEKFAKAPYHAAEGLDADEARALVERAVAAVQRGAQRELRAALARAKDAGHEVAACAVLTGSPMPAWSVEQIRAVHFRMHKAEGVLFSDALVRASEACGLETVPVLEKELDAAAKRAFGAAARQRGEQVARLGKEIGPPWGKDQKSAALAAWIALETKRGRRAPASS